MMTPNKPNIAIFIDVENVMSKHLDMVMDYWKDKGNIMIKRAYANWSALPDKQKGWQTAIVTHGFNTIHQFDHVKGKNSSDIAMSIDILELLYNKPIDVFCLVSSDSDFTPVCHHLRENGKMVVGIGRMNTSKAFVNACHNFIFLTEENHEIPKANTIKKPFVPKINENRSLIEFIKTMIQQKGKEGWLNISILGSALRSHKTFDIGRYGYNKISEMVNDLVDFEIWTDDNNSTSIGEKSTKKPIPKTATNTNKPASVENNNHETLDATPVLLEQTSAEIMMKDSKLNNAISNALATLPNEEGWVNIHDVSEYLKETFGILSNHYGYQTILDLLKNLTIFDVQHFSPNNKNHQHQTIGWKVRDNRMDSHHVDEPLTKQNPTIKKCTADELRNHHLLIDTIYHAMETYQLENGWDFKNGWTPLSTIGNSLKNKGLNAKEFGYKNLSELLRTIDWFDITDNHGETLIKDPTVKKSSQHKKVTANLAEDPNISKAENLIKTETLAKTQSQANIDDPLALELISIFQEIDNEPLEPSTDEQLAMTLIEQIYQAIDAYQDANGWTKVGDIGKHIRKQLMMTSKDFGYQTFADLIAELSEFEMEKTARTFLVRIKN